LAGEGRGRPGRPRKTPVDTDTVKGPSTEGVTILGLARGLQLLSLFDRSNPEWSLNELVAKSGLHKSTVYRVVRTMEDMRFLGFEPDTGNYHLGPAAYHMAYLATSPSELVRIARPHLERLSLETGETAALAVEAEGSIIMVDRVLTTNAFKPPSAIGDLHGMHSNSHGKLFLAFKSPEERSRLMVDLAKLTPNTIVDPEQLERELQRVLADGVAFDIEEDDVGLCAVSAPVLGEGGQIRASISVVAPRERFGYSQQRKYADDVRAEAAALSEELGYARGPV
jgi:IclR family KDG regulon transcriptional repressor